MKRFLLLSLLSGTILFAFASGPLKKAYSHKQKDGTTITVYKCGDGFTGYYATLDGVTLLQKEDGDYYYASFNEKGEIDITDNLAHNAAFRSEAEKLTVRKLATSVVNTEKALMKKSKRPTSAALNNDGTGTYGVSAPGTVGSIGHVVMPFVMVSFPDRQFLETTTKEKVTRLFNEEGYADEPNCKGSVSDYFKSQSHNMFTPEFVVVDQVTVSQGYAHYGKNSGSSKDALYLEFVKEVVDSVMSHGINLDNFIVAKDGYANRIPMIGIYYAGPGEHSSYEDGSENYLWAKYGSLSYTNKYRFQSFIMCNETFQDYVADGNGNPVWAGPGKTDGIGVTCHEFSHALGLPDFYKTSSGVQTYCTMEYWSVMDYGQYWKNSYAPIGYNAYERNFMGWLKYQDLDTSEAQLVNLYNYDAENDTMALRIVNPDNSSEYFILENRQVGTWYPADLGTGMLLTHIDYLYTAWNANSLNNNSSHPRFEFVPADGVKQSKTLGGKNIDFRGDLYPGTTNVTGIESFNFYTGRVLTTPLINITEENQTIHFSFIQDLTGIDAALSDNNKKLDVIERYSLDGRRISNFNLHKGALIEKLSDGSSRIVVK